MGSSAVINIMTNCILERKVFVLSYSCSLWRKIRDETQHKNLGAETEQKLGKNAVYWRVPHGWLYLFSYATQGHLPRGDIIHNSVSLPILIVSQENTLESYLCAASDRGLFSAKILFFFCLGMSRFVSSGQSPTGTWVNGSIPHPLEHSQFHLFMLSTVVAVTPLNRHKRHEASSSPCVPSK